MVVNAETLEQFSSNDEAKVHKSLIDFDVIAAQVVYDVHKNVPSVRNACKNLSLSSAVKFDLSSVDNLETFYSKVLSKGRKGLRRSYGKRYGDVLDALYLLSGLYVATARCYGSGNSSGITNNAEMREATEGFIHSMMENSGSEKNGGKRRLKLVSSIFDVFYDDNFQKKLAQKSGRIYSVLTMEKDINYIK